MAMACMAHLWCVHSAQTGMVATCDTCLCVQWFHLFVAYLYNSLILDRSDYFLIFFLPREHVLVTFVCLQVADVLLSSQVNSSTVFRLSIYR